MSNSRRHRRLQQTFSRPFFPLAVCAEDGGKPCFTEQRGESCFLLFGLTLCRLFELIRLLPGGGRAAVEQLTHSRFKGFIRIKNVS